MNALGPIQRRLLYATIVVLVVSGAYWALLHYLGLRPYLTEPFLMKVHGAAAMAVLILVGGLLPGHLVAGWEAERSRAIGVGLLVICAALALTGYALYYAGSEATREISSYTHLALGLALPTALALHLATKPSRQPASVSAASQPRLFQQELAQCKTSTSKKTAPKP